MQWYIKTNKNTSGSLLTDSVFKTKPIGSPRLNYFRQVGIFAPT
jgi:hypothetical protein